MRDQDANARSTSDDPPRGVCAHCHQRIRVMAFLDDAYCSIDCQKAHTEGDE